MNKLELARRRNEVMRSYHAPGCSNVICRPKNACFFNAGNTDEHELAKALVCLELRRLKCDFITEAVHNKSLRRVDVVCLDTGQEIEVETTVRRAKRFEGMEVLVLRLWERPDIKKWVEENINV